MTLQFEFLMHVAADVGELLSMGGGPLGELCAHDLVLARELRGPVAAGLRRRLLGGDLAKERLEGRLARGLGIRGQLDGGPAPAAAEEARESERGKQARQGREGT